MRDEAVRAWRRLGPDSGEPTAIRDLKVRPRGKGKSAVFVLEGAGPERTDVVAKRCRVELAKIEDEIYRSLLPKADVPALLCYGTAPGDRSERAWLFLEPAPESRYDRNVASHRHRLSAWVAGLHQGLAEIDRPEGLPEHDADSYLDELRRAGRVLRRGARNPAMERPDLEFLHRMMCLLTTLERRWEDIWRPFSDVPRTLVHRDLNAKNIRLGGRAEEVWIFDWEFAGWGTPATEPPATPELERFLRGPRVGETEPSVTVRARRTLCAGSHPKEVVTCRLGPDREMTLLCKYDSPREVHRAHGHRGGVPVERLVYEKVLEPLGIPSPRRFPSRRNGPADPPLLVLEYLEESEPVSRVADGSACEQAARIVGRLHARTEGSLARSLASSVPMYDETYDRGWATRAVRFLEAFRGTAGHSGWIRVLEERSSSWTGPLLKSLPAFVHGEFYPMNILFWNGRVYPVDWESAAVAAGEIDLASLTEGWGPEHVRAWEKAYREARWPDGAPDLHSRTLQAARIYLHLRWLGDRPDRIPYELSDGRLERLRDLSEEVGLL